MNFFSSFRNTLLNFHWLFCIVVMLLLSGCYSFTGGSVPSYLKTLYLSPVGDVSGFGNPRYRETLTQLLITQFRRDNSFTMVDRGGDARLTVSITSIRDDIVTVKPGEVESERKITINCEAEYYDAVKKKSVWTSKKPFSRFGVYPIGANSQAGRDNAAQAALSQLAEDILLAVVSGW